MFPSAQVAAGEAVGVTAHVSFTVDGFSPPTAVIVTWDVAVAPGATLLGANPFAVRLKFGAVTTISVGDDVPARKSLSPE
jgi:hypothetical protein